MKVIGIIVLFLLAHAGSSAIVAREWSSSESFNRRYVTTPGTDVRRELADAAGLRIAKRMKERALSMLQKFDERLVRYDEFIRKVQSRKKKLADRGIVVTTIDTSLTKSTTNLSAARSALSTVRSAVNTIDTSGEPKVIRTKIHAHLETIRTAMRKLHTSTSEAVRATRQATAGGGGQ